MAMNPRLLRPLASGKNPETLDWITRVYANGGTVSTSTANAVDAFCNAIDAAGIRDRFYRLNLFAGTGLNAALVPLYRGPSSGGTTYGNATDENYNFIPGDYTLTGGLNSGASNTSKYLATGLANTDIRSAGDGGFFISLLTDNAVSDRIVMGQRQAGALNEMIAPYSPSTAGSYRVTATYGAQIIAYASERVIPGRYYGSSTAADDHKLYIDGVQSGSNTTTEVLLPTSVPDFYIFTSSSDAPAPVGQYLSARVGFYGVTRGLTATQVASLDAASAAYLTAIGRT